MKKILVMMLVAVMCLAFVACNSTEPVEETESVETVDLIEEETISYKPTVESVTEGIKDNFKDPDSVQVSDGTWAAVMDGDKPSETEFYIICTVRAKNSFGGYAEPQAYVIHSNYGNYRIVEEYNDYSFRTKVKLDEYGCDLPQGLY